MNLDHEIALVFMGIGGIVLLWLGEIPAGVGLLGAIGGYAFKNGIKKKDSTN